MGDGAGVNTHVRKTQERGSILRLYGAAAWANKSAHQDQMLPLMSEGRTIYIAAAGAPFSH